MEGRGTKGLAPAAMCFWVTTPMPTLMWPYMVPPGTWDIFVSLLRWALSFCSSSQCLRAVISRHHARVLMHPPPAPAEPREHPQVQGSTQDGPELAWLSVNSTPCLGRISSPWALAPPPPPTPGAEPGAGSKDGPPSSGLAC